MAKAAFSKKRALFTSTLDLELRNKLVKCYIRSIALYGAETWTLRAVDQKHLESFEMWCWRRIEKISWTDHVRKEDVLLRVKEQRNILHEIRKQKANLIGHILRRNCLLQRVIGEKIQRGIEVTGRRPARPRTQRGYHHDKKVKPEAATAVIELLMMGGETPETCWALSKRQDNKLKNSCIWLVIYLICTMIHGLTNLKFVLIS